MLFREDVDGFSSTLVDSLVEYDFSGVCSMRIVGAGAEDSSAAEEGGGESCPP